MKVIVTKNYEDMSAFAADMFKDALKAKKDTVLGLATGSTPEGMYANLVAAYNAGEIDFAEVKSINLDEYYPIKKSDDQSYDFFMRKHLFSHVNMKEENILN
jgi:glucosamine-6-phosphate deaminase